MPARAVQVSIDESLLKRIDRDRETREKGRSAFIRSAVQLYLRAKERGQVDEAIRKAYEDEAEAMLDDVRGMMKAQAWRDR